MISIIICTYKRASSLKSLLESIQQQSLQPTEILIIDGSPDSETKDMLQLANFPLKLQYWSVPPEERGLTRQRNYGVKKINASSEIVSFFDDDVILEHNHLELLYKTFGNNSDCIGVGGMTTNERQWEVYDSKKHFGKRWYIMDGFALKLGDKNYVRRQLGLFTNTAPGWIPRFGHGYDMLPPSGKTYEVEHLVGCNMSYKSFILKEISFSEYFIGYGLYEDYDFSYRATKFGKLYINTNLRLEHHHHPAGRPDTYKYGKMVTRNGWYVWRLKYKNPFLIDRLKWYTISILLTILLLRSLKNKSSRMEFLGRIAGMIGLMFSPPAIGY